MHDLGDDSFLGEMKTHSQPYKVTNECLATNKTFMPPLEDSENSNRM